MNRKLILLTLGALPLAAQTAPASSIRYSESGGAKTVEIVNVRYQVGGQTPLILRETSHTKEVLDEKGMEARTTVEAWPLGSDVNRKPLYSFTVEGIDAKPVYNELLQVTRGLEDVEWWSVYQLATGNRLFDTFVPPVAFDAGGKRRYAGLEVPGDDAADARLRAPEVVAVLMVAAGDRIVAEAMISCDDPVRARLLRSYFDSRRTMSVRGGSLRIGIRQEDAKSLITIVVPVTAGGLDTARATLPPGIRIAAWKR